MKEDLKCQFSDKSFLSKNNLKSKSKPSSRDIKQNEIIENNNTNNNIFDNNYFYINLKDTSETNTPNNINKINNHFNNLFSKSSSNLLKNLKEKNKNYNIFNDVSYKYLDDIKEFLIPYSQSLKDISLKEIIESNSFKDAEIQTAGVIDSRIQNLAITIDKVIHVMDISKDDKPPLIKLSIKDIIINLWTHPYSLRWSLINNIHMLKENLFEKGLIYNNEELDFILEILTNDIIDINEYENIYFSRSESIYNLIKIILKFINENIKDSTKEEFYLENKQSLNVEFFDILDKQNSYNNKYCFSFKDFNIKKINKFPRIPINKEEDVYWINTKQIEEREKIIKKEKIIAPSHSTILKIKQEKKANKKNSSVEKIFKISKNNLNSHIKNPINNNKYNNQQNKEKIKSGENYFLKDLNKNSNNKQKTNNSYIKKRDVIYTKDEKFLENLKEMKNEEANKLLHKIKNLFKFISFVFKVCHYKEINFNKDPNSKFVYYEGLSDLLYMHSCTQIYFMHNDGAYDKQVNSCEIVIRDRDVNVYENEDANNNLDKNIHTGSKKYEKMYIWGQLVGWFKQSVNNYKF